MFVRFVGETSGMANFNSNAASSAKGNQAPGRGDFLASRGVGRGTPNASLQSPAQRSNQEPLTLENCYISGQSTQAAYQSSMQSSNQEPLTLQNAFIPGQSSHHIAASQSSMQASNQEPLTLQNYIPGQSSQNATAPNSYAQGLNPAQNAYMPAQSLHSTSPQATHFPAASPAAQYYLPPQTTLADSAEPMELPRDQPAVLSSSGQASNPSPLAPQASHHIAAFQSSTQASNQAPSTLPPEREPALSQIAFENREPRREEEHQRKQEELRNECTKLNPGMPVEWMDQVMTLHEETDFEDVYFPRHDEAQGSVPIGSLQENARLMDIIQRGHERPNEQPDFDQIFGSVENPYLTALYLMENNKTFRTNCTVKSLTHNIVVKFERWIGKHKDLYVHCLDPTVKAHAMYTASRSNCVIQLFSRIAKIYDLHHQGNAYLVPFIRQFVMQHQYKEAAHLAVHTRLQDSFNVDEIIKPLLLEDEANLLEQYVCQHEDQQRALVMFIDHLFSDEDTVPLMMQNCDIPNIQPDCLELKRLLKIATRHIKLCNIQWQDCPNISREQVKKSIRNLIYKRYDEQSYDSQQFEDMALISVKDHESLQLYLIEMLVNWDVEEAARWALHFKLQDHPGMPSQVVENLQEEYSYVPIRERRMGDIAEAESDTTDDDSGQYHALALPQEKVTWVDSPKGVHDMLEKLCSQRLVGMDGEWRPTFGARMSLLQLATRDDIFLVDMLALSETMEDDDWTNFAEKLFVNPDLIKLGYDFTSDLQMLRTISPALKMGLQKKQALIDMQKSVSFIMQQDSNFFSGCEAAAASAAPSGAVQEESKHRGLTGLVKQCLGKPLNKTQQMSDWEKRPLRPEQMKYAALDAYCLIEIYDVLKQRIKEQELPIDSLERNQQSVAEKGTRQQGNSGAERACGGGQKYMVTDTTEKEIWRKMATHKTQNPASFNVCKVWRWKTCYQFLKHIWNHIRHPDEFPNCCTSHILYLCNKSIQKEVFGTTKDGEKCMISYTDNGDKLGQGSYAECFLVKIIPTGKLLAVKRILEENFNEREIEVVRELHRLYPASPHGQQKGFAHVYAVTYDGTHVEVFQDYIQGITIAELCRTGVAMELRFTHNCMMALLYECCVSLQAIHAAHIVHRDMSPNNIIIALEPMRAVIIDFGLSSLLPVDDGNDTYPGNIYYMSPQAARSDSVDDRTDVWGVMMVVFVVLNEGNSLLYELLLPCTASRYKLRQAIKMFRDNTSNRNRRLLWERIREFELEEPVLEIVQSCLRCTRADRFTARQAAAAAHAQLNGQGLADQPEFLAIMQHHFPPDTSEPEIVEVLAPPGENMEVLEVLGEIEGPIVTIGISGDDLSGPSLGPSGDQQGPSANIILPPILPSIGPDGDNGRLSTLPIFVQEEEFEGAVGPDPSIGPYGDLGRPVAESNVQEDADDTEELEGAVGPDPRAVSSKQDNDDDQDEGFGDDS